MFSGNSLPRLPSTASPDEVAECIAVSGAVVVERLVSAETMDVLSAELAVAGGCFKGQVGSFAGQDSRRNAGKPIGESALARTLAVHPLVLGAASLRLRPHCRRMVLGTCTHIRVEPPVKGDAPAPAQILHRDERLWAVSEWPWMPTGSERPELGVSVMWALTDFGEANGATRIVPGSHRWLRDGTDVGGLGRSQDEARAQSVAASMPQGSVLLWSGGTVHGAGAHAPRCDDSSVRSGLLFIYNLGWLRSEQNFHHSIPRDVLVSFDVILRELIGLAGENAVEHPWYTGPVYAQPYMGGPSGTSSGDGVQFKVQNTTTRPLDVADEEDRNAKKPKVH